MKKDYIISTDMTTDLDKKYFEDNNVIYLPYPLLIDGKEYDGTFENTIDSKLFYEKMRNGSLPTTSLVSPEVAKQKFEEALKDGKSILHICFSSGLSGTYSAMQMVANELNEKYPDQQVVILDSLNISSGEAILVRKAVDLKAEGKTLEENQVTLEEAKKYIVSSITVDNLSNLKRTGRISSLSAMVGSVLRIKPILYFNENGKLSSYKNSMGRKKSMLGLVELIEKNIDREKTNEVYLSQADCEEDANKLKELIENKLGLVVPHICPIGPTLGTHSGPDCLGAAFICKDKMLKKKLFTLQNK